MTRLGCRHSYTAPSQGDSRRLPCGGGSCRRTCRRRDRPARRELRSRLLSLSSRGRSRTARASDCGFQHHRRRAEGRPLRARPATRPLTAHRRARQPHVTIFDQTARSAVQRQLVGCRRKTQRPCARFTASTRSISTNGERCRALALCRRHLHPSGQRRRRHQGIALLEFTT